jgi:hypothetical protein
MADKIKRFLDCFIPVLTCNLRCHYCYVTQRRMFSASLPKFPRSPKYIAKAISVERLGGHCFVNLCGGGETLLIACNFTPQPRFDYNLGVPIGGEWIERLNSDAARYGGSNIGNFGSVFARQEGGHGRDFSVRVSLPPLAVVIFKPKNG